MNDNTQLLILATGLAGLLMLSQSGRTETFVSGNVVGIQADLKRAGLEKALHASAAAVADSTQGLGCVYLAALAAGVEKSLKAAKGPVPCSRVTDHLKKLQNSMESRIKASKLSQQTKEKMKKYAREAVGAMKAVFDPLCEQGTFDAQEVRGALKAVQASYCAALPNPAKDAVDKPVGLNDPELTTAVQDSQKALTEHEKKNGKSDNSVKGLRLRATLAASRAALMASNAKARWPSQDRAVDSLLKEANASAKAAQKATKPADIRRHAIKTAAAAKALQAIAGLE